MDLVGTLNALGFKLFLDPIREHMALHYGDAAIRRPLKKPKLGAIPDDLKGPGHHSSSQANDPERLAEQPVDSSSIGSALVGGAAMELQEDSNDAETLHAHAAGLPMQTENIVPSSPEHSELLETPDDTHRQDTPLDTQYPTTAAISASTALPLEHLEPAGSAGATVPHESLKQSN